MSEYPELTTVPRYLYYVERDLVRRQAEEITRLRASHARLLAALRNITAAFDGLRPFPPVVEAVATDLVLKARAAIAAAEGGGDG